MDAGGGFLSVAFAMQHVAGRCVRVSCFWAWIYWFPFLLMESLACLVLFVALLVVSSARLVLSVVDGSSQVMRLAC